MIARLGEILLLLLLIVPTAAASSESRVVESSAASIAATAAGGGEGSNGDPSRTKHGTSSSTEPPLRYETPPVPLPVQTRAGQRQLKLLRGQTSTFQQQQQQQRRRRLGQDKAETEVPEPEEMTTKAPTTNIPTTLVPAPSPAPMEAVAVTREPTLNPRTTQPVSAPEEEVTVSTRAPNTTQGPVPAPPTEAPAATQPPQQPQQPPVTPPPTFNNNINVTTVGLAPFTVQVQADAPEQEAEAVYEIYRQEVRKTLQTYLASALDYDNLVFVQLSVEEGRRRELRVLQQQEQQQPLVDLVFRYTGDVVFRSVAPDRTDVVFRQRQALLEDSTSNARQAAVRNNDILKAGNVQIVSLQVDNDNNEMDDKSVSDDDDGMNIAIIGGIVAAAVVVVLALAILVWHRRRPPTVVSTANKSDKTKTSTSSNNNKTSFSPYGKEHCDDDDDDDEGRIISTIDLQAATTAESTSPKSYLQLSPSGALAKQPGASSGDEDEDDRDNAAAAVVAAPDSPDDEKDDAYNHNYDAYKNNPAAAAAATTPSPHPRSLETTSLLGTGARLMGVGDPAPPHPMDEEIMMIQGAALNSISNDDSEKIMKQHPADQLYSVPILQVARSDESSVDGYSLVGGLYGQSTANNKKEPAPTITLLPSLSSPPPPPPPTGPSWMQPRILSTPQQQQPQQHDNDDGSEYTSDSESQFVHEKSVSNNKTTLTTTPTLLPRTLSVDSGEDDDSVLLSLRDRPPSNSTTRIGDGAIYHVYPANGDQNSALRVLSVYSDDFDEASSSAEQPNDSTIDDDDLLRQAAFSPRVVGAGGKDDALGFELMGTPATALLTPSPNVSRITKGFDGRSDEDDDTYEYIDIVSDAAPWDESKDELELSGGSDLAAQLDSLKRQADEMLAVPVAGLPRDGDQLVVPPSLRTSTSTPQTAAHRTPGSVRRRGKPPAYGSAGGGGGGM